MAQLLLIDDDPAQIQELARQAFPVPAHRVGVAGTGTRGLHKLRTDPPDVILLDCRLPDKSLLEVYERIRSIDARIPVILVTMVKGADAVIEAMKPTAYGYLFEPVGQHQLRRVIDEALDVARRMRQSAVVAVTAPGPDVDGAILGGCPRMREVYKAISRVAGQDVTVVITGESSLKQPSPLGSDPRHGNRCRPPTAARERVVLHRCA
jgi:DNA-binding NtrC family response regulator